MALEDILIVAPYNDQVNRLVQHLPGAKIGTVDKFQGPQAAVVIYSMTTSTPDDAPRGMEFLYNLNRFNVATSRALCLYRGRQSIAVLTGMPHSASNGARECALSILRDEPIGSGQMGSETRGGGCHRLKRSRAGLASSYRAETGVRMYEPGEHCRRR